MVDTERENRLTPKEIEQQNLERYGYTQRLDVFDCQGSICFEEARKTQERLRMERHDNYSKMPDEELTREIYYYRKMLRSEWRIDESSGPLDADLYIERRKELHKMEAIAKGRGIKDQNYGSI
ncbi:MAG: hypothetical protein NT129_05905 [Candidatus Aenigmarchaeota archaeon]|nr:hypothetical protein [Candidatus Aenigmarchaeota archaeon]